MTVDVHYGRYLVRGPLRMTVDGLIRTLDQVTEVRILDPQPPFHLMTASRGEQRVGLSMRAVSV